MTESIIVYHGTNKLFNEFEPQFFNTKEARLLGKGFYFSTTFEQAREYASTNGYVYKCRVKLTNTCQINSDEKYEQLKTAAYKNIETVPDKKLTAKQLDLFQKNITNYFKNYDSCYLIGSRLSRIVPDELCVYNTSTITILSCKCVRDL